MVLGKGTMKATAVAVALVWLATGCSGVPATPSSGPEGSSQNESGGSTSGDSPTPAGDFCSTITSAQLESIFGKPLGDARPHLSHATSNDLKWTATGCGWGNDDELAVHVVAAAAADFEDGVLHCVEPLEGISELEKVPGLGEQAWWKWGDAFGMDGDLRICTSDTLYDIKVSQPEGESSVTRDQAIALADLILD